MARVAAAFGVTTKTVRKWRARHAAEGLARPRDRSSRPHASPARLDEAAEAAILALRRQRLTSPAIARQLRRPVATVGRVLRRHCLGRLAALDAKPEILRYQRERPGELIHLDIKKLGRIDGVGHRITGTRRGQKRGRGWDFLHVCVDDASRLAYTASVDPIPQGTARRASRRGKAERFIQTSLREWAYLRAFASSIERTAAMRTWLHAHNRWRPHAVLGGKPPLSRLVGHNLHSNDN